MASLSENRTLRILDAAAKGNYGVLAAIAYAYITFYSSLIL